MMYYGSYYVLAIVINSLEASQESDLNQDL